MKKTYNQMNEVEMDFFSSQRAKMNELQTHFEERMLNLTRSQEELDRKIEELRNGFKEAGSKVS
ncbi:hypothetical protein ACQKM1_09430 [Peribacillus frigoritolerans]|uniref:hypothetical protein n=1 Tax=Peribacillus frigoritolerans TaxID=450367 RepID=UPI003D06299A